MGKGIIGKALIGLCVVAVAALCARGQEPEPDAATTPAAAASPTPAPETDVSMQGDVITLKSGAIVRGGQVVRGTATDLVIEFIGGAVTLAIPRRFVDSIDYDGIDPVRDRRQREALRREPAKFTVVQGQKVNDELRTKLLATDVANTPLKYEEEDLVDVLKSLSERFDVPIFIGEPVMAMPPAQRKWTFEAKPGTNLSSVLNDGLVKDFDDLQVVYQFDNVLVTTREAAKPPKSTGQPVPGGADQPGEAENERAAEGLSSTD